jgi:hypothetical protein
MSINITTDIINKSLQSDGKTIFTTITNYGYILYTLNMLKSLRRFGIDKLLIVCIDKKSEKILSNMGYNTYLIGDTLSKFYPWNDKGYDRICYFKSLLFYRILELGYNFLYIDGDIVFLKNPINDFKKWIEIPGDIWIQNDTMNNNDYGNACTGYLFVKWNSEIVKLFDCISEEGLKKYEKGALINNDQSFFNEFIKGYVSIQYLPLEQYPNGKYFYEKIKENESCILVHFNWVKGHEKLIKMKKYNMWFLTEQEEEFM